MPVNTKPPAEQMFTNRIDHYMILMTVAFEKYSKCIKKCSGDHFTLEVKHYMLD